MSFNGSGPLPHEVDVAILGAGFSGLGMAIRMKQAGYDDFIVLERDEEVGGTWWANTYPGCACDIPSHLSRSRSPSTPTGAAPTRSSRRSATT